MAIVLLSSLAQAAEVPPNTCKQLTGLQAGLDCYGPTGKNAEARAFSANTPATAGADGRSIDTISSAAQARASGTAVIYGSTGGLGGKGDIFLGAWEPGGNGGRGGDLTIVQTGALTGIGDKALLAALPTSPLSQYRSDDPAFKDGSKIDPRWRNDGIASLLLAYSQGGSGGWAIKYGGAGGDGGNVNVTVAANLDVEYREGYLAVWARSLGGHSGVGGENPDKPDSRPSGAGGAVTVTVADGMVLSKGGARAPVIMAESLGGNGGSQHPDFGGDILDRSPIRGGDGGAVSFANNGTVRAQGDYSTGIVLQSVGGTGGSAVRLTTGAAGGNGGTVTATNSGLITTKGLYGFGVLAQSVGGSGGKGGKGYFSGYAGGGSGNGGAVTITNLGTISTEGLGATAIVAQSVGGANALDAFATGPVLPGQSAGQAGTGGSPGFIVGWGGTGGTGGNGGAVNVFQRGIISTTGDSAYGILAQSIGGGGGTGGAADTNAPLFSLAVGGNGGGGGNGGTVTIGDVVAIPTGRKTVVDGSKITTSGDSASAVVALSVGGGGGAGGAASAKSVGSLTLSIAVGGAGGKGGKGGEAYAFNTTEITTSGLEAHGIEAKSVGGGGGKGGNASAYALAASPPGYPAVSMSFAVGGAGGEGGNGGYAQIVNLAPVTTTGEKAYGLFAQSVGGGGGAGGAASAVADVIGLYANLAISAAVGGSGGGGGDGGAAKGDATHFDSTGQPVAVMVNNAATVSTSGAFATGIFAQSVGGGGGDGGTGAAKAGSGISLESDMWLLNDATRIVSNGLPVADTLAITAAVGGSGGAGGAGKTVIVDNYGTVSTSGLGARGIFAQSVGGGGGNAAGFTTKPSGELSVSVGGLSPSGKAEGGGGGNGGTVNVTNAAGGLIETRGSDSAGIFAQSVGGGGGNGGSLAANSGSKSVIDKTVADYVFSAIGNIQAVNKRVSKEYQVFAKYFSGSAAADNHAFLGKKSTVQKFMTDSQKYISAVNAAYKEIKSSKGADAGVALKAAGVAANELLVAGATKALKDAVEGYMKEIKADPWTKVPFKLSASLGVGARGGSGGDGGDVIVTNLGEIRTFGKLSAGIFAQSVGGGGGSGGAVEMAAKNWYNAIATIGGTGGDGGKGGSVRVDNAGLISTAEAGSFGILAQSVGGGGGVGGAIANSSAIQSVTMDFTLGGTLGTSGKSSDGGKVSLVNSGTIATAGKEAHGIVAQSIGGGGGIYVVGRDSGVAEETKAALAALDALYKSMGITDLSGVVTQLSNDQSTAAVTARLGGQFTGRLDTAQGNGGAVDVTHAGTISTSGFGAIGILAQSIGGGGGLGVDATSSTALLDRKLVLGGNQWVRSNGGNVSVHFDKDAKVQTTGDGAIAVFLQSIGGGGGYGGGGTGTVSMSQPVRPRTASSWLASAGKSGDITIDMGKTAGARMTIATTGAQAHGIFAQNLQSGGGYAFDPAKTIPVPSQRGYVVSNTRGFGANILSSGGDYDYGNYRNGNVKINTVGTISASGAGSYGIFIQNGRQGADGSILPMFGYSPMDRSEAGRGVYTPDWNKEGTKIVGFRPTGEYLGNKYYLNWGGLNEIIHQGTIYGGSGEGAAIRVDGGDTTIWLKAGSQVSAASGTAILTSFGEDRLTNDGLLTGNVNLASGGTIEANLFTNSASGEYRSLPGTGSINLGAAGRFVSRGVLDIGGVGQIGTLTVSGGSTTLAGTMRVDINTLAPAGTPKNDLLKTDRLTLDGVVIAPNVIEGLAPGNYTIIQASQIDKSQATASFNTASPISWKVLPPTDKAQVQLKPEANFMGAASGLALSPTQLSFIGSLQSTWDKGDTDNVDAKTFGAMASISSQNEYREALASMSPEGQQQPAAAQTINSRNAISQTLSCPIFVDASTTIGESQCAWARVTGTRMTMDESSGSPGFTQTGVGYRAGGQWEIAPDWFLGATAGYLATSSSTSDGYTTSSGSGGDVSLALKRQLGMWYFAAAIDVGYGTYKFDRLFDVGDVTWFAEADSDVWTGALRTRVAYEVPFQNWYLRPYLDVDLIHTYMPGYALEGDGATLTSSAMRQWTLAIQPAVEIGARIDLGEEAWLRPFGSLGVTYLAGGGLSTEVSFGDSAGNNLSFTSTAQMPDVLFDVGAGVQLFMKGAYELRGEYKAQIADKFLSQEAMARAAYRF